MQKSSQDQDNEPPRGPGVLGPYMMHEPGRVMAWATAQPSTHGVGVQFGYIFTYVYISLYIVIACLMFIGH